jgi:hypothetical protein
MQSKPSKAKLPQQIIYAGILSGALLFGPKWGGFWAFTQATLGGVIGVAGVGQLKRREESKDVPANPWEFVKSGVMALGEEYEEIRRIVVERLPEPLADLVNVADVVGTDGESKFRELHKYSLMIVARTNGGKTWFQHQSAILSLEEQAKGGTMRVMDRSYGKRKFRWHGLPRNRVIYTDVINDLPRLLNDAIAVRNSRIKEVQDGIRDQFPWYLLHITELNESMTEYTSYYRKLKQNDEHHGVDSPEDLIDAIGSLLFDGHGYQIFVRVDAQSLAVGETNINQAKLAQLNVVVRGSTAIDAKELGKILPNASYWVDKVTKARKDTGDDHISLAIIEGKPSLFVPPDLASTTEIVIAPDADLTPTQAAQQWAQPYADSISAAKSPTEAFNVLKEHMPTGYQKQSSNNPYYQAIKALKETES